MANVYIVDYASSIFSGIGSYMRELIFCLQDIGAKVCLVVLCADNDQFSIVYENGIKKMLLPSIRGSYFHNYNVINFFLRLYISDSSDNIFLVNRNHSALFLKSIKELFPKSKTVFVVHDMVWTSYFKGSFFQFYELVQSLGANQVRYKYKNLLDSCIEERQIYRTVDKIIVLTKQTEKIVKGIYAVEDQKIFYVPNGLRDSQTIIRNENDKLLLKQKLFLNTNEKIILYTGRNNMYKGCYQLLNSFEKVLKQYPNCRLVMVGNLDEPSEVFKSSSNIASKVTYTGHLNIERVHEWYRVADIGVLPSYFEQCSYSGIEMMMFSLSIVSSDGFGLCEMFTDGENAKIAAIGDISKPEIFEKNLAESIIELLMSDDKCKQISKNAREKYLVEYNISHMVNSYSILLNSLLQ